MGKQRSLPVRVGQLDKETNKEYAARMERERHARVRAAARSGGHLNSVKVSYAMGSPDEIPSNGECTDQFGRKHVVIARHKAAVLSGTLQWTSKTPFTVKPDILPRPGIVLDKKVAHSNISIPCVLLKKKITVYWMPGKSPFYICRRSPKTFNDEEYVSAMLIKDVRYGQVTVCTLVESPHWIMKHGLNTTARMEMLRFCIGHSDYRKFRLEVRERAWRIINGEEKIDLTTLRLAATFSDFAKHPKVSELMDLDRNKSRKLYKQARKGMK